MLWDYSLKQYHDQNVILTTRTRERSKDKRSIEQEEQSRTIDWDSQIDKQNEEMSAEASENFK